MITFEIEALHGKGRPRFRSAGRFVQTYTDKETVNFENLVKLSYMNCGSNERFFEDQPLKVVLEMYQEIPKSASKKKQQAMLNGEIYPTKKPDVDNVCKAIFDALNGVCFKDDTQVVEVYITKKYDVRSHVIVGIDTI